jgi:RNA-binding protein
MSPLSGPQKTKLKSLAHHLKPVVYIGKNGLSESLIAAIDKALSDHELIKIKFVGFKDEKGSIIDSITQRTGAELVSIIGNIAILFRRNEDLEKQGIAL